MPKITIKPQKVSEAKRFFEILRNPNFVFLSTEVKSLKEEIKWLKKNLERRRKNLEHNYTIFYGKRIVGGIGIKINQHRKYIGEIGYFIDENYWGKGIATEAVKKLEMIGFTKLKLERVEIVMDTNHKASEKVAIKCGYEKEGIMKKSIKHSGKIHDSFLYAKVR